MDEAEFEAQVTRRTQIQNVGRKSRMAISSEVAEADADWKAPVFDKTAEQEKRLMQALSASFMFAALSGDNLSAVIKAFQEMKIDSGTNVITEGDEVVSQQPALYVLESGKLSVSKKGQEGAVLQYTSQGQYFGELALLYNAPRAATVVADEVCTLWSIDRDTFTYLVKDAARMAVKNRIAFLEQVPILKGLDAEEKAKLSDVMNVKIVSEGEYVIKQGEEGTTFYILESGKLEARKDGKKALEYNAKDYFGELALLRKAPRAADVVATELSKVLSLDVNSFKRLCGSLEDMMKERAAIYSEVTFDHCPTLDGAPPA
jgi:cAMP-dependent protein kinase regulator